MAVILKRFKRFWLKQRIQMLRADISLAVERRDQAQQAIESLDRWYRNAQERLRKLKANLSLVEHPQTLLNEALRHE